MTTPMSDPTGNHPAASTDGTPKADTFEYVAVEELDEEILFEALPDWDGDKLVVMLNMVAGLDPLSRTGSTWDYDDEQREVIGKARTLLADAKYKD